MGFEVNGVFTVCSYIFLLLFGEICIFFETTAKSRLAPAGSNWGNWGYAAAERKRTTEHTESTEKTGKFNGFSVSPLCRELGSSSPLGPLFQPQLNHRMKVRKQVKV